MSEGGIRLGRRLIRAPYVNFGGLGHCSKLAGYLLAWAAHSRHEGFPAAMRPDLLVPNTPGNTPRSRRRRELTAHLYPQFTYGGINGDF